MRDPSELAREIADAAEVALWDNQRRLHPDDAAEIAAWLADLASVLRWTPGAVAQALDREVARLAVEHRLCEACLRPEADCTCEPDTTPQDAEIVWAESRGVR